MSLRACCARRHRPAATSPGGVERRGAPTKVCKGATLACSGAESAATGHTGDWLAHARPFAHSGDVVTICAEALHYLVDRFPSAASRDRPESADIGGDDDRLTSSAAAIVSWANRSRMSTERRRLTIADFVEFGGRSRPSIAARATLRFRTPTPKALPTRDANRLGGPRGLLPQGSHGPGRADFPHPVRQFMVSLRDRPSARHGRVAEEIPRATDSCAPRSTLFSTIVG